MINILIVAAIAISIIIGYRTKINTGFFAIIFSYILGCFVLGLKPKQVIGGWPIGTMFVIFSVSLFYNFALVNGTLEKTARNLLYACRHYPALLPFALYFASAGIAALGAGFFTVMAFMAPIALLICEEANMDKMIGATAVNCGALSGANFMTSGSGIVFRGLMTENGYAESSFHYTTVIFLGSVIFSLLLITGFRYLTRHKKQTNTMVYEKPEAYTPTQRLNLSLILLMILVVLIFPVLHIFLPGSSTISYINSKMDVGLVSIGFSAIALLLNLAPQSEVIKKVPWNTIIMICGVGMLIHVAIEAGTLQLLASWVGSSLPNWMIPIAFSIVGAIMSFFSSTLGVVCPALFPLVPDLAATTGMNPLIIFCCIIIGAQSSAISPFSSGGSLVLGSCTSEEERNHMFPRLLFIAVPISVLSACVFNLILAAIL
ncbi:SLC13 family permease [Clostridium sp. E02]|uniref:SLC13 family permease n=1 Tax=Clostridium sp. E02 TaxID=2487134 RepID=UPI000F536EB1|nr:SLC13 family permease [Clostridium sp. E02]